jgi:hypothetical protein
MTQKTREEYEADIKVIDETTLLETIHRQYEMSKLIANILLDIRDNQDKPLSQGGSAGSVSANIV